MEKMTYIPPGTPASYRYTQRYPALGWLFMLLVSVLFTVTLALPALPYEPFIVLSVLLGGALYTLSTVSVNVTRHHVVVWLGLPIDKIAIPLEDILEHQQVEIPAWRGTGLRLSFEDSTWLYGFRSPQGVVLKLKTGRQVIIGTDKPAELHAAISRAVLVAQRP